MLDEEGDSYLCLDFATGSEELLRWFRRSKKKTTSARNEFTPFLLQLCQEIIEDEGSEE